MSTDQHRSRKEKNIILTGFMGVGKTTIGHHIAQKLNRPFIDADQEIEKLLKMPVTQIFSTLGEQKFREIEKDFIIGLCKTTRRSVVSLGGGAFLQLAIRNVCLSTSYVVFLNLGWNAWKERLHLLMDNRPILQGKSLEEIEVLYHARQAVYACHHWRIDLDGLRPEEAADKIVQTIRQAWESSGPMDGTLTDV
ncbi:shikimate kinase [Paenibacillus darwinianus]|uniref:Shikimate kinase n=1 Tax=Paenibacillus darwinianus TaxID=1380763 RepID=A0A9W5W8M3_9BACL|nr:shikimate kinase [Paenibacillus darwinianus]EXX86929.1 shikimate kinase [Paenibacillus darwinianus]EXX90652.1 shikimate kinase [Paenibacillus darwinianus]EXX91634.1 shikimate kinase [Paenibacillus darwinianus]